MENPSIALAEPLLHAAFTRCAQCHGQLLRPVISLGFAVLLSLLLRICGGFRLQFPVQELAVTAAQAPRSFRTAMQPSHIHFADFVMSPQATWLSRRRVAWPISSLPDESGTLSEGMGTAEDVASTSEVLQSVTPPSHIDEQSAEETHLRGMRTQLVELASGLDRGLDARQEDVQAMDTAAHALEERFGAQSVDWTNVDDVAKLSGKWRLMYTSAFAPGHNGGAQPGLRALWSNGPLRLGKVFQRIQMRKGRLDNIIEPVYFNPLWPLSLPSSLPSPSATIRLGHTVELVGKDSLRISGDSLKVQRIRGPIEATRRFPPLGIESSKIPFFAEVNAILPQELKDAIQRAGTFRVTYLDDEICITRGDRDELRVFARG